MTNLPAAMQRLAVPVIAAPMFIVSTPRLVIAQCTSGIVGSLPALNGRSSEQLDEWLGEINDALAAWDRAQPGRRAAPYAVNLIVHRSNTRLERDLEVCVRRGVKICITSLGAQAAVNDALHTGGAFVFHDVINRRFAVKALEKGADGLVAVAAGAGGHAGTKSPFALMQELRAEFDGPIALSGAIATGDAVLAAQALGANFAYVGSAFIATDEAAASDAYKASVVAATSDDILYTNCFTGVHGNYLLPSIRAAGLDPDKLPAPGAGKQVELGGEIKKAWKDIWGCGQGVSPVQAVVPAAALVERLAREYAQARKRLQVR